MLVRRSHFLCAAFLAMMIGPSIALPPQGSVGLEQLPQDWLDDSGRPLKLSDLRGQRLVLTMAYANCHRFCPMTIDALRDIQQRADKRQESMTFVVVGYDPTSDTPETWHRYRLSHRLDRLNWHFLSGSTGGTKRLARQLGFPFWIYDGHVMHESRAIVFDAHGLQEATLDSHVSHWSDTL